jgi:16S rRNA (guanine1516-N2)-methyltransferase
MTQNTMNTKPVRIMYDSNVTPSREKHIASMMSQFEMHAVEGDISLDGEISFLVRESSLSLIDPGLDKKARVQIDFTGGATDHRRRFGGGKSQSLAKAIGLDQKKGFSVVDATAGLAADSFVMACLGANVLMLERSPVLALMITEGLHRASQSAADDDQELANIIQRMQFLHVDAFDWLKKQENDSQGVVYLDPMFPERKKKAAVKKEMQLLQSLLEPSLEQEPLRESEERDLLEQAIRTSYHRTVVKRPRNAPVLGGQKPGYSLEGKSTRFDIYPKRAIS